MEPTLPASCSRSSTTVGHPGSMDWRLQATQPAMPTGVTNSLRLPNNVAGSTSTRVARSASACSAASS
jgi:hypothetical protein